MILPRHARGRHLNKPFQEFRPYARTGIKVIVRRAEVYRTSESESVRVWVCAHQRYQVRTTHRPLSPRWGQRPATLLSA